MRDHFCPASLAFCCSLWNYSKTSPLLCMAFILQFACFGRTGARSEGYSQDPPLSYCTWVWLLPKIRIQLRWGWVWISDKHLRESLHQQRKRAKDVRIADLHRTAEAPRKSTVIADANNKFTVLCCTLSTTLLLVLLTSHYIAQN